MSLISTTKQQEIKKFSINNEILMLTTIDEVEELELDKLLGSAFYQDIVENYDTNNDDKYKELVEGSTFEDCDGNTLKHKGLWYLLAYLNYAEYITTSQIQDTFTGMVSKTRPDSQLVSSGTIKNLRSHNREIGFNHYEKTRQFLEVNASEFPLYCSAKEVHVKKNRFKSIRNNQ